jgi:hypothetical protein
MRFLRTLAEGDRFRVAHPRQVSLNKRPMPRDSVFRVKKVYPMAPHTTISMLDYSPDGGFYSLGPGTPVLLPMEPDPSEEEVMEFIGVKTKKRVVAYKVLWDGKTNLSGIVPPQAIAAMKLMHAMGKSEYGVHELNEIFNKYYERFWGKPVKRDAIVILLYYRRYLVNHGLLEEVVDVGPIPGSVREANLQEEYR